MSNPLRRRTGSVDRANVTPRVERRLPSLKPSEAPGVEPVGPAYGPSMKEGLSREGPPRGQRDRLLDTRAKVPSRPPPCRCSTERGRRRLHRGRRSPSPDGAPRREGDRRAPESGPAFPPHWDACRSAIGAATSQTTRSTSSSSPICGLDALAGNSLGLRSGHRGHDGARSPGARPSSEESGAPGAGAGAVGESAGGASPNTCHAAAFGRSASGLAGRSSRPIPTLLLRRRRAAAPRASRMSGRPRRQRA